MVAKVLFRSPFKLVMLQFFLHTICLRREHSYGEYVFRFTIYDNIYREAVHSTALQVYELFIIERGVCGGNCTHTVQ